MKQYAKALASLPFVFAVVSAHAQSISTGLSLRAGVDIFAKKETRDLTKASSVGFGVTYKLPQAIPGLSAPITLDLDYSDVKDGGNKISSLGLFAVSRFTTPGSPVYAGLGIGVASTKVKYSATVGSSTTTVDKTKTVLSGKLILGANLSDKAFIEAFYKVSSKVEDIDVNSYGIQVGIKF